MPARLAMKSGTKPEDSRRWRLPFLFAFCGERTKTSGLSTPFRRRTAYVCLSATDVAA
jgi:hypothetical protein